MVRVTSGGTLITDAIAKYLQWCIQGWLCCARDRKSNCTGALYRSLKCLSYRDMQKQYNAMEMANRVLKCIRSSWCIAQSWWVRCTVVLCRVSTSWPQLIHRGTWQLKGCHRRACKRELKSSQSDNTFFFCFHF